MNLVSVEDMQYLEKQSAGEINFILAGMTALMNENEQKTTVMESQNWFRRMIKTVTGQNRVVQEEIQKNYDQLNAYMSEAIAELYNRNCIDRVVMLSLGNQMNELYMDHAQLKEMLGLFASRLGEKTDSIDNFHMLNTEIEQGIYPKTTPLISICKIMSQFDRGMISNKDKMDIIQRNLERMNIIDSSKRRLKDYLLEITNIPTEEAGLIYLELGSIRENYLANIFLKIMDGYYFLPDMQRNMKSKESLVDLVVQEEALSPEYMLSLNEVYSNLLNSKIDIINRLISVAEIQFEIKYKEAGALYSQGKYSESFAIYKTLAEKGYIKAYLDIASGYEFGYGVESSNKLALEYYKKFAESGNAEGQNILANKYYAGEIVEQNYEIAVEWYRKSADQGFHWAEYNLANMYYYGRGVVEDNSEALKYYHKAYEHGNAQAANMIGIMYYNGYGVEKNGEKEFEWMQKSANMGYTQAKSNLANCYYSGRGVEKNIDLAEKWYMEAAQEGNDYAATQVGIIEVSRGNYVEAVKWYRKAAENGYADAQNRLGVRYDRGEGVEKNSYEAVKWYRKAAEQGHAKAQCNLGICYEDQDGIEDKDIEGMDVINSMDDMEDMDDIKNKIRRIACLDEAKDWYEKSAEQGYANAQIRLANLYVRRDGQFMGRSIYRLYNMAAEQGDMRGDYGIGDCYLYGYGVKPNPNEAIKWYQKAANQGHSKAITQIEKCKSPILYVQGPIFMGTATEISLKTSEKNFDIAGGCVLKVSGYNLPSGFTIYYSIEENSGFDTTQLVNYEGVYDVKWGEWIEKNTTELIITRKINDCLSNLKLRIYVGDIPETNMTIKFNDSKF